MVGLSISIPNLATDYKWPIWTNLLNDEKARDNVQNALTLGIESQPSDSKSELMHQTNQTVSEITTVEKKDGETSTPL